MSSVNIWVIILNNDYRLENQPSKIKASAENDIDDLKDEIKQKYQLRYPAPHLSLWKLKTPLSHQGLFNRIGKRIVDDQVLGELATLLDSQQKIGLEHWPDGVIHVIVQLPLALGTALGPAQIISEQRTPRLISDDTIVPSHQAALLLYKHLWGNERGWDQILTVEPIHKEDIEEMDVDDETETLDMFIDLRRIKGWRDNKEFAINFAVNFLIRREYMEFEEFVEKEGEKDVLLTGQPGIGKTYCLTYLLLKRLVAAKPTVFASQTTVCYLFNNSGAYECHEDNLVFLGEEFIKGALHLVDLNASRPTAKGSLMRTLVSSSPQTIRFKEWLKQTKGTTFYMKTWGRDEMWSAKQIIARDLEPAEFRERYIKYGFTPRIMSIFKSSTMEDIQEHFEALYEKCNLEIITSSTEDIFKFDTNITSYLLKVGPAIRADGTIRRSIREEEFVSVHVAREIMNVKKVELANQANKIVQSFHSCSTFRSAEGAIFEVIGHITLFRIRTSLHLRPLRSIQPRLFDLSHLKRRETINTTEPSFSQMKLEDDVYYQPIASNLAGIDSFAITNAQNTTILVMFQFTIRADHPIKTPFIKRLRQRAPKGAKMALVFVVPKVLSDKYKEQALRGDSNSSEKVMQYVCGLADEDLEVTMKPG